MSQENPIVRWATLALGVILVTLGSPWPLHGQPNSKPWADLKYETAWIMLGQLDATSRTWATLPGYKTIHSKTVGDWRTPNIGDTLTATHELSLYILGYKQRGEARRLEALTNRSRHLDEADLTGGNLSPGMRVIVEDIRSDTGRGCDTLCTVWARVKPAP